MPNWLKARRAFATAASITVLCAIAAAQEVPGRLLVKFHDGVSESRAAQILAANAGRESGRIDGIDVHVVSFPAQADVHAIANRLNNLPDVAFAETDRYAHVQGLVPNDPAYATWEPSLPQINAPAAWSLTTGSPSVVIAVLDTGVYTAHADLAANAVPGWNVYNNSSDVTDTYGHGTRVAGVACASSNNGIGVASVAWNCKFMPVKVTDSNGNTTYSTLASGVMWALNHGAKVVNMSFQLTLDSTLDSALSKLQAAGGVATAAAGNYSSNDGFPANPYLITVSGVDATDNLSTYSSFGNDVDISAPYTSFTCSQSGGYTSAAGTSFAAPIVAGAAALVMSANPNLSSSQVEQILEASADDKGAAGWDMYYGYGRVNLGNAVAMAMGTTPVDTTPPTVSFTSPADGGSVAGTVGVWASATDNNQVNTVTFYVDGVQAAQCLTAPYTFNWDTTTASAGSHTLKVVATDAANNSSSASISVNVANADTTPPTVTLTAPVNGSGLSGTVSLSATASDNVGVASVSFYCDGSLIATDTASPYVANWDSTTVADGSHTLSAVATDAAGNSATSSVSVTVSNNATVGGGDLIAPTITITSPASGSKIGKSGLKVSVNASDNVGVVKVQLYLDGVLVATSTSSPWTTSIGTKSISTGTHSVYCVAYDAAGNTGTSQTITVVK